MRLKWLDFGDELDESVVGDSERALGQECRIGTAAAKQAEARELVLRRFVVIAARRLVAFHLSQ